MKYVLFLLMVLSIVFYLLHQRRLLLLQKQRLAQAQAKKQADFVAEVDALNPHLRK